MIIHIQYVVYTLLTRVHSMKITVTSCDKIGHPAKGHLIYNRRSHFHPVIVISVGSPHWHMLAQFLSKPLKDSIIEFSTASFIATTIHPSKNCILASSFLQSPKVQIPNSSSNHACT